MIFKSLKDKCNFYRDQTDYHLMPNTPILVMIDGKNFSKLIKNKFEKPFDDWFINAMNETAIHLCKNIQNCIGAFVQSDEITLIIKDNALTCAPFDGRLCKLQSIIPAMATAFFMKKIFERKIEYAEIEGASDVLSIPDYIFDCKVWNVPNENDAMAWVLYRQIDCIRNSKQQFAQTYVPHKTLLGHHTDEQIKICKEMTDNDWDSISNDKKFGRLIYKTTEMKTSETGLNYIRSVWKIVSGELTNQEYRELVRSLLWDENNIMNNE